MTTTLAAPTITRDRAITIAEADALPMYGSYLHTLELRASLHGDGWHLVYSPQRDGFRTGGGPHYVIDATTGAIVSKTYYQ